MGEPQGVGGLDQRSVGCDQSELFTMGDCQVEITATGLKPLQAFVAKALHSALIAAARSASSQWLSWMGNASWLPNHCSAAPDLSPVLSPPRYPPD
jgi:hypothetical protein